MKYSKDDFKKDLFEIGEGIVDIIMPVINLFKKIGNIKLSEAESFVVGWLKELYLILKYLFPRLTIALIAIAGVLSLSVSYFLLVLGMPFVALLITVFLLIIAMFGCSYNAGFITDDDVKDLINRLKSLFSSLHLK